MDPRPPTESERKLVLHLLPVDGFPEVDVYRRQANHLTVVGCCECGCGTLYFKVDQSKCSRAEEARNPLPVEGRFGEPFPWELILFTSHGWLESIEVVPHGDESEPLQLPQASEVTLERRPEAEVH